MSEQSSQQSRPDPPTASPPRAGSSRKLTRGLALSVAAGAALYVLLATGLGEGRAVWQHLRAFSPTVLLLGLLLASLNYLFRFAKWQYYLRVLDVNTWPLPAQTRTMQDGQTRPYLRLYDSLLVFFSGFALTVTPGKVGEVLKSYLLKESHHEPLARTAPIVFAERLTDLLSLLLLALLGIATWMSPAQRYFVGMGFALCLGLILLLTSRALVYWLLRILQKLPPQRLMTRLCPKLHELYDSAYLMIRPVPLLLGTVLSIVAWFCECLAFYWVVRGCIDGAQATLLLCTFIYALMTVAGALAFVPGGLGVTEGGMVLMLAQLGGLSSASGVAATLVIRVQTLWFAVLLGVLAMLLYSRGQHMTVSLDSLQQRDP